MQAVDIQHVFAKIARKLTACLLGLIGIISYAQPTQVSKPVTLCSYVYEFNFHDPLMRQKSVRQAIKTMIFAHEISRGFGEPLYFVLPKPFYEQEWRVFVGTAEQYLREIPEIRFPLHISLLFHTDTRNETVANRMVRMLSQSELFRVKADSRLSHFQLAQAEYCANDPYSILARFHSQSPENRMGYVNLELDNWLDRLKSKKLNSLERDQLIHKIVRQLESDIVILPLFQYQRTMHAEFN